MRKDSEDNTSGQYTVPPKLYEASLPKSLKTKFTFILLCSFTFYKMAVDNRAIGTTDI